MPSLAALDTRLEVAVLRSASGEYVSVRPGQVALARYKVTRVFGDRIEIEIDGGKGPAPDRVWLWVSKPGDTRARFAPVTGVPDSVPLVSPVQARSEANR